MRALNPYGNRNFRPIWEASTRHGLGAGIHFGGASGNPPTAIGLALAVLRGIRRDGEVFASQLTSLISEGAFDRLEGLG